MLPAVNFAPCSVVGYGVENTCICPSARPDPKIDTMAPGATRPGNRKLPAFTTAETYGGAPATAAAALPLTVIAPLARPELRISTALAVSVAVTAVLGVQIPVQIP